MTPERIQKIKRYKLKKKQETKELHEWFQQLWEKLPKKKKCQSCGTPIWGENKSYYWDHLIEKNIEPELKFLEWNIMFVCSECHTKKSAGYPTVEHSRAIEKAQEQYRIWKEGLEMYEKLLKK